MKTIQPSIADQARSAKEELASGTALQEILDRYCSEYWGDLHHASVWQCVFEDDLESMKKIQTRHINALFARIAKDAETDKWHPAFLHVSCVLAFTYLADATERNNPALDLDSTARMIHELLCDPRFIDPMRKEAAYRVQLRRKIAKMDSACTDPWAEEAKEVEEIVQHYWSHKVESKHEDACASPRI